MSTKDIAAGFLPLLDSAILVAAKELGFAEDEGLALTLHRETSWANIRDRLAIGHFQAAHNLAPMPIAANLGLNPIRNKMIAPMALGLGGNAVTISNALFDKVVLQASGSLPFDPMNAQHAGDCLKQVIEQTDLKKRDRPLQFAVVHPFSAHNYELRYWLSAVGIDLQSDVEIVILPPSYMPDALALGQIDGFCVGEPWNSVAIARGVGKLLTVKQAIWASSPEKVLGIDADWATNYEDLTAKLIRAVYHAAKWCREPENKSKLAAILSRPDYLGHDMSLIEPLLSGIIQSNAGSANTGYEPHAQAATFPWQSHALWFYSQMVRWGHVKHSSEFAKLARETYRPDLYRQALASLNVPIPAANAKVEGMLHRAVPVGVSTDALELGPDTFFDGRTFDPDLLDEYLSQ